MHVNKRMAACLALTFSALLASSSALACGPLWVHIQGGEAKLAGSFKTYLPATASIPCGETADINIEEGGNKFVRRSGSVRIAFDGATAILQIGLRPIYFNIPPNGIPTQTSLDDGQHFRNGVVLNMVQTISR